MFFNKKRLTILGNPVSSLHLPQKRDVLGEVTERKGLGMCRIVILFSHLPVLKNLLK